MNNETDYKATELRMYELLEEKVLARDKQIAQLKEEINNLYKQLANIRDAAMIKGEVKRIFPDDVKMGVRDNGSVFWPDAQYAPAKNDLTDRSSLITVNAPQVGISSRNTESVAPIQYTTESNAVAQGDGAGDEPLGILKAYQESTSKFNTEG